MRTIQLIYPELPRKKIGKRLAIRDLEQIKHLKVLRADFNNYRYLVTDGKGLQAEVKLLQKHKEGYLFKLIGFNETDEATFSIEGIKGNTLILPIVKQTAIEEAVTAVSQLGYFKKFQLYFSDYTRYTTKTYSTQKLNRLQKLANAAVKQSKAAIIPQIDISQDLQSALDIQEFGLVIVPDLGGEVEAIDIELLQSKRAAAKSAGEVALVIGAEGGFSPKEREIIKSTKEIYRFSYGNTILTTETAAIIFSGMLQV